jgi:hypothetical protein
MSNPQQPELARSRKTPAQDQDAVASVVEGQRVPAADGPSGPVPAENQPGHHPAQEQDKPDLDAFAQKIGVVEGPETPPESGLAGRDTGPQAAPTRSLLGVAGAAATLVALVLAVVAGKRRRSRRRSR